MIKQFKHNYLQDRSHFNHLKWAVCLVLLIVLCGCYTEPLPQGSVEITLVADGSERKIQSNSRTVLELLVEQSIRMNEADRVSPPETAKLFDNMTVTITRIVYAMETITDTVPFERRIVRDATVPEGESRLVQSGSPGMREMFILLVRWPFSTARMDGLSAEAIWNADV